MAVRPLLALALVQAACFSKPAFEGGDPPIDAAFDAPPDTPPAPACLQFSTWGTAQYFPSPVLSANADTSGWISEDRLELMFWSNRDGGSKFYRTRRPTIAAAFGQPTVLPGLTPILNGHLSVSADGLRLWFDDSGGDIYTATREMPTADFGSATRVAVINSTPMVDHGVDVNAEGTQMVFMRGTAVTSLTSVQLATRSGANDDWSPPVQIASISGSGCCPTHTPDADELIAEINGMLVPLHRNMSGAWDVLAPLRGGGDPYMTRDGRTLVLTLTGNDYDLAFMERRCENPPDP